MDAEVQPNQPPNIAFARMEWLFIAAIMAIGLIPRLWSLAHTEVAARDSIGFIRCALELETPPLDYRDPAGERHFTRAEVLRYTLHPPGYPLWVLLVSKPVRAIKGDSSEGAVPTAQQAPVMAFSAQLASILASLLLVIPMYFLGRRLFGPTIAALGTGLFQILPVVVQLTSDGLSESFFLLMAMTTLWLMTRAFDSQSYKTFFLVGCGVALSYLVRPEGLILGVGFAAFILCGLWTKQIAFKGLLPRGLAVSVGFLLFAMPYIATIGGLTNKTTGKGIIDYIEGKRIDPTWQNNREEAQLGGTFASPLLFAVFSDGREAGVTKRTIWAIKGIGFEFSKTGQYIPAFLALIGFIQIWHSRRVSFAVRLILCVIVCHLGLLFLLAFKIGYISDRHTMLTVALGCFLAVWAVLEGMKRLRITDPTKIRRYTSIACTGLFLLCFAGDFKTLHAGRAGHHWAGNWLAKHIHNEDIIWDPFNWAEYYAGRSGDLDRNPAKGPVYTIIEPQHDTPHSRLPMLLTARQIAAQGEPVYHWPENKPINQAKVVIYRTMEFKPSASPENPHP